VADVARVQTAVVSIDDALLSWRGKVNPIVAFWSAFVVTRQLGASVVDWLGKPLTESQSRSPDRKRRVSHEAGL
jgi:uncharacterized membrane-anchored protein